MLTRLEGRVARIRYQDPQTSWTVVTLEGREATTTVVGELPGLQVDMEVALQGEWAEHPRHGRQFEAGCYTERVPATQAGLVAYLGSGLVHGFGKKLAERVVNAFGAETMEVIRREPERVAAVKGIGPKRAKALSGVVAERRDREEALVFLYGLGIGGKTGQSIFQRYGPDTVRLVRANPYRLADEERGIGFRRADQYASHLGISNDHPARLRAAAAHALEEARDEGHCYLTRTACADRAAALVDLDPSRLTPAIDSLAESGRVVVEPIPQDPTELACYLPTLYEAERDVAQRLARTVRLARAGADIAGRIAAAALGTGLALAASQRHALELALHSRVTIITGGPGTGKTTITRALCEASADPEKVALAAPTGRAAKRLSEATGRDAKTIHRLLEFSPAELLFRRNEAEPLRAERVVVDEASMIDLPLFASLVRAIAPETDLVLVGDSDQLPPVGPGSPFLDLIASGLVPVARLTEIFRQGRGSAIVEAAHRFNQGIPPRPTPSGGPLSDFYFVQRETPETVLETIRELICRRIPAKFGLDPKTEVQVLAPMKTGPLGVEALNRELQSLLNPGGGGPEDELGLRTGDKVMQVRNDYERGVFNGDLGVVRLVEPSGGRTVVAMDGRDVVYTSEQRQDLVLAYAITVHKSQGSEYRAVVMPVTTQHYRMLQRNLVYTGITRGKELVVLVGSEKAARIAAGRDERAARNSLLAHRLLGAIGAPGGARP
jgi:exodeoxyribonuclease V alpha subunit